MKYLMLMFCFYLTRLHQQDNPRLQTFPMSLIYWSTSVLWTYPVYHKVRTV